MSLTIKHLSLSTLSPEDEVSIRQVLEESDRATIFHSIEWNRILSRQSGFEDIVLLAIQDEHPVGVYVFFVLDSDLCYSSLANMFSIYGGPVAVGEDVSVITALLRAAESRKPLSIFHIWSPPGGNPASITRLGYRSREMFKTPLWHLNCTEEELWSRLDKDKRTKIRKAMREGVAIVHGSKTDLDQYQMLVNSTLDGAYDPRSGNPIELLGMNFYKQVMESLEPIGMARLFLATYKGEYISGSIVLYFKDTVYAWDIGWRREFANLSPNDLLAWTIASHAHAMGCRTFDLMVIDPLVQPGIAKWKMGFGVEVLPCYYHLRVPPFRRILHAGKLALTNFPELVRRVSARRREFADRKALK